MADRRWELLERARPDLVRAFADDGVHRIEYVAAFPVQGAFAVWLGTGSDAEAARLRARTELLERVASALHQAGFTSSELAELAVVVQSQETVDRDYAGSWFFALR